MAVTKLWPIRKDNLRSSGSIVKSVTDYAENDKKTIRKNKAGSDYAYPEDLEGMTMENVISYIENNKKTEQDIERYVTTINCSEENSVQEMLVTKKLHREKGKRIMWHGYQSFAPGEVTPEQAHRIGVETAERLWGDRYEIVVTTHLDRKHLHNHIVINSVSFVDGKKFDWDTEYPRLRHLSDELCREDNISVVKTDEISGHYHRGQKRAAERGNFTLQSIMKEDIDSCIIVAGSFEEFVKLMNDKGYHLDDSGKYLKIYKEGHKRPIRVDRRWGEGYTIEGIRERILSEYEALDEYIAGNPETFIDSIDSEMVRKEVMVEMTKGSGEFIRKTNSAEASYQNTEAETVLYMIGSLDQVLRIIIRDVLYLTNLRNASLSYDVTNYFLSPYGIRIPGYYRGGLLRGLGAGFVKYNIAAGIYRRTPKQVARTHYIMRDDLIKLDRYIAETKVIIENDITDEEELRNHIVKEEAKLNQLYEQRKKIQNKIRRAPESDKEVLKEKLREMNREIRLQKKAVFYAMDIQERFKEMEERIEQVQGREKAEEKKTEKETKKEKDLKIVLC